METKECNGVVVLLDALGARNLSMPEAAKFLDSVKEFVSSLNVHRDFLESGNLGVESVPQFLIFGDTIIVTWDLQESKYPNYLLMAVAEWLRPVVLAGMAHGILWRGAIAMGPYVWSPTVVIGPAVADAASWYEAADWFGVIATPNCSQHLSELEAAFRLKSDEVADVKVENGYVKYDVPLKGGATRSMWAVNWPRQFELDVPEARSTTYSPTRQFHSMLQNFPIPLGTETKYENAERFFHHCTSEKPASEATT